MMLSREKITKFVGTGEIAIAPFNEDMLKDASYTFTLGKGLKKLKETQFIDSRLDKQIFEDFDIGDDGYLMQPGEFLIAHTEEVLRLNKGFACILSVRGSRGQMGLDALGSELFCEPNSEGGWNGQLMLEMMNRGPYPIKLFPGIKIVKGIFFHLP